MGAKGAGYYRNGFLIVEDSVPAGRQVNTTGTGDVLSVCMMLLDQERRSTIGEKLRLANLIVSQFIAGERSLIPAL
jgi:sugar/nucleoside kinase (ribokinase family)